MSIIAHTIRCDRCHNTVEVTDKEFYSNVVGTVRIENRPGRRDDLPQVLNQNQCSAPEYEQWCPVCCDSFDRWHRKGRRK